MDKAFRMKYTEAMLERYLRASKKEKGRLLDEMCRVCGYHRKHAIAKLRRAARAPAPFPPTPRRGASGCRRRERVYDAEVMRVAQAVWEAAGNPWSVRLKEILRLWMPWVKKRFRLSRETRGKLLSVSAGTLDRGLRGVKRRRKRRLYGRTKPGTLLLRREIPVGKMERAEEEPGWAETDTVSHSGASARGEFLYSLNLTDVFSQWTETFAVKGKGAEGVARALEAMRRELPFSLRGLHSDTGSEFVNSHLLRWCRSEKILFLRSRPYKKDDNARVEQKNWTHVRRLMGWERYDTGAALLAMNDLYRNELRLWMNLFQPSVKLRERLRKGSRLTRRYEAPRTPLDRLAAFYGKKAPKRIRELLALRKRLDPFALSEAVERKLGKVWKQARIPTREFEKNVKESAVSLTPLRSVSLTAAESHHPTSRFGKILT